MYATVHIARNEEIEPNRRLGYLHGIHFSIKRRYLRKGTQNTRTKRILDP